MGGKHSRRRSSRQSSGQSSRHRSSSSTSNPLPQRTQGHGYNSLEQVTEALARAGLGSSNLIVGIDFTKSNEWTGARSSQRSCLHSIGHEPNPYEQALSIIGKTLSPFNAALIPCFGFGDELTRDQEVFCFNAEDRFCRGFEEVLSRYRELVPHLRLSGPTSFAPIIEMAITVVERSEGQYHVLLIIADGQVTRSVDTHHEQFSAQERETVDAIVKASEYPLSIILVGVGDGPWDMMQHYRDHIPTRAFNNFQFVNFTEIMSKNMDWSRKEAEFASSALMEIPSQYMATQALGILGNRRRRNYIHRIPLPPPQYGATSFYPAQTSNQNSFHPSAPPQEHDDTTNPYASYTSDDQEHGDTTNPYASYTSDDQEHGDTTNPYASSTSDDQFCPICLTNPKDMAFGCGHRTCCECAQDLQLCPLCRSTIDTRIRLY